MITQFKQILYATDLSENSSYAFLYAVDMARRHEAKIIILHVVEPIPREVRFVNALKEVEDKERGEIVKQIQDHLRAFCKRMEGQIGSPCVGLVSNILVPQGIPAEEILNAAKGENCDAIVLGSHGKGFLSHTFLGSVSTAVLQRTRKPVLIVPLPVEKTDFSLDGV
jgi:nucleotide-binding universal stress UspA family protein